MRVRPLADCILVKPFEADNKTEIGIYIPDTAKEKTQMGKVMAVGKDVKEVKLGDQIVYRQYGPDEVRLDGEDLLILKEEDVLGKFRSGNE